MDPTKVVILKTETTGLSETDEVVQVVAIDGVGEVLMDTLVKPSHHSAWPEAEEVNHISPESVKNEKEIGAYADKITKLLEAADLVVGYNIDFDLAMLRQSGVTVPDVKTYDVMMAFSRLHPRWDADYGCVVWARLAMCTKYYGYAYKKGSALSYARAILYSFYRVRENAVKVGERVDYGGN